MAVVNSDGVMDKLFGNDGRMDGQSVLRQQATLQIFMPVGRAILEAYENVDPLDTRAEIEASFGELLTLQSSQRQRSPQRQSSSQPQSLSQRQPSSQPQQPTLKVLEYINSEIQRELPPDAGVFDILQVPLVLKLSQLHGEFLSNRMSITQNLRALSEVVSLCL